MILEFRNYFSCIIISTVKGKIEQLNQRMIYYTVIYLNYDKIVQL